MYYDYLEDYRFMHPEEFDDTEDNQQKALIVATVCAKIINENKE